MPARPAPLRILCYAVNGLGLGHLTRLIAICRQLRRLTTVLQIPTEIVFLTSSEGDSLAALHGFATFKVPSKTVLAASGLEPIRYRRIMRQWIWNAANLISPDLLLVDTFPAGSLNELPAVLDLGTKNVFIHRGVRPEVARQPAFQASLSLYDLILKLDEGSCFGEPASDPDLIPEPLRDRVTAIGPVLLRSVEETFDRATARELLGLPPDCSAVYLSTGGGGDRQAEALLRDLVEAARLVPEVRFVVGAGMLYRGREWAAPNVSWTRRPVLVECFRAFDLAITAGGFNTVWELIHLEIPCLFLPQPRGWDDQDSRAARCAAAGAGCLLSERTPEAIAEAVRELLAVQRTASSGNALLPRSHALDAAIEILSLRVERSRLEDASAFINPGILFAAEQEGLAERDLLLAAALITSRTVADPENTDLDAGTMEDALLAARELLRHVASNGGATRQALAVLKKLEHLPTPEAVAVAAMRRWDDEYLLKVHLSKVHLSNLEGLR